MTRKYARCPNCNTQNAFDEDAGRVIDCISCCYDEHVPPTYQVVQNTEQTVILTDTQTIKRGCTFEVDNKGKVVRVVSNG
jgi:Zn ribbon nucleic-acid-binding protein